MKNGTPNYYNLPNGKTVMDLLKDVLTREQMEGFILGNIFKYRMRAGKKEDALSDLKKAEKYENFYQEFISEGE